ncbi:hypothetical protein NE237_003225 [Protea cynaroides]|uniref:MADS-box domain-containing protein n=1 Tax=Protea cynaroides TaxID=273540 RepID=A0A9Q0KGZ9_9MAGN|nr:hypothetical protein NE237_003225 [Protea cynaroides]
MGRAKVKLERIAKEKSRNTTFQKRKKGLKKKAYEFSTLCGVDACLIIFGPNQSDGGGRCVQPEPETWPENHDDVLNIIEKFRMHSREEQVKRQTGVPQFFEDKTKKIRGDLVKLRHRNNKYQYPTWDDCINDFSETQLRNLIASLNSKIELLNLKIDLSERNDVTGLLDYSIPPPLNQYPPLPLLPPPPYWDSYSIDYVPSDPSLVFQTTMVNSSMDFMGDRNGAASSSIIPCHPASAGDRYGASSSIIPYNPESASDRYGASSSDRYGASSGIIPCHPESASDRSGASSSIVPYQPGSAVAPILPTFDEMAVINNTGGEPFPCYFSPDRQPMMHSYFTQQLHSNNDFFDLQDYLMKH